MRPILRFFVACAALLLIMGIGVSCAKDPSASQTIKTQSLVWAVYTALPTAKDFVKELPDGYSVRFAEEYTFTEANREYPLQIVITPPRGREYTRDVTLRLVIDEEAPTIVGVKDLNALVGGSVSYRAGVSVVDNCNGPVTLTIDTKEVDLQTPGIYPIYYTATDAVGNRITIRMSITVSVTQITGEMLYAELDPIIARIIKDHMTTKEKAHAVYQYIRANMTYGASDHVTDKSSVIRGAYEGLSTGVGDCYTYFALSKAFFDRLGIENLEVSRRQDMAALADERHFWNLVNIGSADAPVWYHFDACPIKGKPDPWGFLMTDGQLSDFTEEKVSYTGVTHYFYAFDADQYPKTPTEIITKTE